MKNKIISIITISFNNAEGLNKTLTACEKQKFKNYELVVVDGGSSDNTNAVISKFQGLISSWVSEKDKGIYDAMNKGVKMAKGDWVIFMNAGDEFYDENTLFVAADHLNERVDFLYGNVEVKYDFGFSRTIESREISSIWKNLPFSHQSLFSKREFLVTHPFDLKYPVCADYEFCMYWYSKGKKYQQMNSTLARIEAGGMSESERLKTSRNIAEISLKYMPNTSHKYFFVFYSMKESLMENLKNLLPSNAIKWMTRLKYRS